MQLGQFDGTNLKMIPFPQPQTLSYATSQGPLIVFNNKLYLSYDSKLAEFDGSSITLKPNPVTSLSYDPIVYNNKLYLNYGGILIQFDGTSFERIKINPDQFNVERGNYNGSPFIYDNKLYFYCSLPEEQPRLAFIETK